MSTAAPVDVERLLANTPDRLRERPQRVCWKYIQRAGKATKCPVNARTGAPADSTDPSTWVSFDEAVAACRDRQRYATDGTVHSTPSRRSASSNRPRISRVLGFVLDEGAPLLDARIAKPHAVESLTEIPAAGRPNAIYGDVPRGFLHPIPPGALA